MAAWPWDDSGSSSPALTSALTYPSSSTTQLSPQTWSQGTILNPTVPQYQDTRPITSSTSSPTRTYTYSNGFNEIQAQNNWQAQLDYQKKLAADAAARRNQAVSYLSGAMSGPGMSGPVGNAVNINAGPIWSKDLIQQQINSQRAGLDNSAANQNVNLQRTLAGRGYGSNSPLYQALSSGAQMQARAAGTSAERDTRLSAAQANAQQIMQGQSLQEQQRAALNREQITRDQANIQRQISYANMLAQALMG